LRSSWASVARNSSSGRSATCSARDVRRASSMSAGGAEPAQHATRVCPSCGTARVRNQRHVPSAPRSRCSACHSLPASRAVSRSPTGHARPPDAAPATSRTRARGASGSPVYASHCELKRSSLPAGDASQAIAGMLLENGQQACCARCCSVTSWP
jgi:hypothetical protein